MEFILTPGEILVDNAKEAKNALRTFTRVSSNPSVGVCLIFIVIAYVKLLIFFTGINIIASLWYA